MSFTGPDVDLVYLWVDGSDPAWLAKKIAATGDFAERGEANCKARYVQSDELKYSLRSVEKHVPWIRTIFIVTDNQVPSWLDTSNPRIRIVDHAAILPADALPCFNSIVLEYFLHDIPGLSERFLYANDDTFFAAPLTPAFFFASDGYPFVRLRRKRFWKLRVWWRTLRKADMGPHRRAVFRAARLVEQVTGKFYSGIPHHNVDAYRKSDYRRAVEHVFKEAVEQTRSHRVRSDENVSRAAFSLYALAVGHAHRRFIRRETVQLEPNDPAFMDHFFKHAPVLFCLNDNEHTTAEDRGRMRRFLEDLFPEKSAFET